MNSKLNAPQGHRIKLLALDMDDTLLDKDMGVSPGNRRALAAAAAKGVEVVLASGRSPAALMPYVRDLDLRGGHLIACNGSQIIENDSGRETWSARLTPAFLGESWDLALAFGQSLQTYGAHGIAANRDNPFTRRDSEITGLPWAVVDRSGFMAEPRVKVIMAGDPRGLDPVEAQFKTTFQGRANMVRSKPYFFEVMPLEADKGLALARLAGMLGILREEVLAIGDSWNDEGMLRWAGVSVAMANGAEEVRRIANWVTTRGHDDDGVAEAIARFIL